MGREGKEGRVGREGRDSCVLGEKNPVAEGEGADTREACRGQVFRSRKNTRLKKLYLALMELKLIQHSVQVHCELLHVVATFGNK